ncbi:NCS2 family permease [Acetobacteraceae bacterium]|nr:NCS2 family permease [Acetobacteraceae bacterium]
MNWFTQTLNNYFEINERGSTISREIMAGIMIFAAMAYIMAVNPTIMASAGLPKEAMIITTIAGTVVGTLLMALWARLPIVLAPAMSSNVVFANVIVQGSHVTPYVAFSVVIISGLLFTLASLTSLRRKIVENFPAPIILGIQLAIGAFIARLGLIIAGIVTSSDHGMSFGKLSQPTVILELIAMGIAIICMLKKRASGLLLLIAAITISGLFIPGIDGQPFTHFSGKIWALPHYPTEFIAPFDFKGYFDALGLMIPVTLYLLLNDFFDASGTLISVASRAGLCGTKKHPTLDSKAYICDGAASVVGAVLGTSTVSAYVESATGVEAGGRTGLTAATTAFLFLISVLFWPLLICIPALATAPLLVMVGIAMMGSAQNLPKDIADASVPLLMILLAAVTGDFMMTLTCGMILYTTIQLFFKRYHKITPTLLGLDLVFILYLVLHNFL